MTDIVVITASKVEELLLNAPTTMTVVTDETIGNAPAQSVTDLLQTVPGLNMARTSARDVNVTTRAATGTLADSMLVLLDGRSVYQDFFAFVLWDFLPVDTTEIKQIEVIRGPASAVWGANAMTGVINVITKTPREMQGTSLSIRFGQFDRSRTGERFEGGGLFSINATHAAATSDRFSYKVSAGLLTQEPFLRPVGNMPGTSTPYPAFENRGTTQPRLDARVDYETPEKKETLVLAGGISGTEGIIHSGLGPFDIQRGSTFKYGRLTYTRDKAKLQVFVNALDAEAPLLLLAGLDGRPLRLTVENQAYDVEFSDQHVFRNKHVLSYGGNYRHNSFDISMAPRGDSRDEGGAYVQDQIYPVRPLPMGRRHEDRHVRRPRPGRAVTADRAPGEAAARSDDPLLLQPGVPGAVLHQQLPRDGLPHAGRSRRRRAGHLPDYRHREPQPQGRRRHRLRSGVHRRIWPTTLGAAVYVNRTTNMIMFTQAEAFTPGSPARFTYRNFDAVRDRGLELSVDTRLTPAVTVFANYSWQEDPEPTGFSVSELNLPPSHRVNAGVGFTGRRYFGSLSGRFVDSAFWQDWDPRYRRRHALVLHRRRRGRASARLTAR